MRMCTCIISLQRKLRVDKNYAITVVFILHLLNIYIYNINYHNVFINIIIDNFVYIFIVYIIILFHKIKILSDF